MIAKILKKRITSQKNNRATKERQKLVAVASPLGRCGSSAMMGLLDIANFNVGDRRKLAGAAAMNPKGFFELRSQDSLLARVYKGIYPEVAAPPTFNTLDAIGKEYYNEYNHLLESEFRDDLSIAVKSQRFLTIPFLYYLQDKFDIKVVVMSRDPKEQVGSILRVWRSSSNLLKQVATYDFVDNWLKQWLEFSEIVRQKYPLDYLDVNFQEIIHTPLETMKAVTQFLEVPYPEKTLIEEWVDPSLVNRKQL